MNQRTETRNPTQEAIRNCAFWLQHCLKLGWKKTELDALEALWWKYHNDKGELTI